MKTKICNYIVMIIALPAMLLSFSVSADDFTNADIRLWASEYDAVVAEGREVFTDPDLGSNGVACAQCHPNAANTHPETYPKFQKQLGKVAMMWEMVNWCIRNPLEGKPLPADDPDMIAIQAYIHHERRGVVMVPGKH